MKVLFLIPPPLDQELPAERIFGCNYGIYAQPNIFILYPATVLAQAGYEVAFKDFPAQGLARAAFTRFCRQHDFDLIVFYTVFLSKRTDLMAKDLLHQTNPSTRFIFMATEPSAQPDDFLDDNSLVIRGEPESRIVAVVKSFEDPASRSSIPGISYGHDGRKVHQDGCAVIDNLDSIPFPNRTLLGDATRYCNPKLSRLPFTTMLASRGCSFGCYYCVPNSLSFAREIEYKRDHPEKKPPVRLRSAANVVAEFTALAKAGYRSISFIDDQFVWGGQRTLEICKGIEPLGVEWSCLARADMLQDEDVVNAMGRAGCKYVDIGIESFNQAILDYIGKGCKVEAVYSAVRNLKNAGIEPELNILLASCPLETAETIEHTFQEALRLDIDYVLFSVCTPFPYTTFNRIAKAEGWMIKPNYEPIDPIKQSFISYPHLTKDQLETIIRQLYLRFYFRPAYLYKRLRKLNGWGDLRNKIKAAFSILR